MSHCLLTGRSSGGGGAEGIPTSNCQYLTIARSGSTAFLKWKDPGDTVIDGQTLATWAGTKIVRKTGGFPKNPKDGTEVLNSTIINNYLENPYEDIVDGTNNYYYAAFPYTVNGVYNLADENQFNDAIIYGFAIDKTDSNPATRVSYISGCDNENFTPAYMNFSSGSFNYGSWENAFFMPKPCMLKFDGTVDYYLNKNDYTLKDDGTASDIANQSYLGNAMMEFPQVWIKFINDGSRQKVYISNKQVDSNYKCYTHYNRLNELIPKCYVSIFDGVNISNKLRSISGVAPMNSQTVSTEVSFATANGLHWYTGVLADWMMINMLLVLIGKSTDSQTTFGNGHYTGGSSAGSLIASGTMNTRGLFWGTNGTGQGVKVFGIENYWGNLWKRIAGWINASGTQKIKLTYGTADGSTTTGYNQTGADYIALSSATPSGTSGGYISSSQLNSYGLYPVVVSGSQTTYFGDGMWFNNEQTDYALVGGACSHGFIVGCFASDLTDAPSSSSWALGAALSCKPAL